MENIQDRLVTAGHRRFTITAIIISQCRACLYLLPYHWEYAPTGPEPDLDRKIFAFDGKLVKNQGHNVKILASVFHLLPNQVLVATVEKILTALIGTSTMD